MTRVFSPSISARPFRMALPTLGRAVLDEAMLPASIHTNGGDRTPWAEARGGDTVAVSMSEALVEALRGGVATPTEGWAILLESSGRFTLVTPAEAEQVMTASADYDRAMELNIL